MTTKKPVAVNTSDSLEGGGGGGGGGSSIVARLDATCMTTGNYDACIFLKNPVAQRGGPFPQTVTGATDLSAYQIYGVPIAGLDGSGFLQNPSMRVIPTGGIPRVTRRADGTWRYPYSNCSQPGVCSRDNVHRMAQLMAYYWLDYQAKSMEANTGDFYAKNRNILVSPFVAGYPNADWDFTVNRIQMGEIGQQDLAISAEVYLHENGHANVHYATMGGINGAADHDILCGQNDALCCDSFRGCMGAINEGQADYHAAMIFPQNTGLGEAIINNANGFIECGLPRTTAANQNLTANTAYMACANPDRGEIHVTGRIYASIWFELRRTAGAQAGQIDTLFTEHLPLLTPADDFETAGGKMITLDNAMFAGAHVGMINAEFARRGLAPQ